MPLQSRSVVCYENRLLADWFFRKQQELDISEKRRPNMEETLKRAFIRVCDHPTPIRNLHDAKQVNGIGTWLLQQLKDEFFEEQIPSSPRNAGADASPSGRKVRKGPAQKRYLPGKNTAAYALLITLYRSHQGGLQYMKRQELIDATEKSGLSRKPIMPPKQSIWNSLPSKSSFYGGWSTMNSLITKGLVSKSSNPAKYMLTTEGKITARECMQKSGLEAEEGLSPESDEDLADETLGTEYQGGISSQNPSGCGLEFGDTRRQSVHIEDHGQAVSHQRLSVTRDTEGQAAARRENGSSFRLSNPSSMATDRSNYPVTHNLSACSRPTTIHVLGGDGASRGQHLAVPPLDLGERFSDAYEVICVLDRREQFRRGSSGSHLIMFAERLATQFQLKVETRQVPVGDALWIARHKRTSEEYVLDFVIERKTIDDLWQSIRDHRYKTQKLRMLNCGLRRLIYLVEGDVNMIDSTEACKTAMLSTEICDGFHVLRTSDTSDTLKHYGNLTLSIKGRYQLEVGKPTNENCCKTYSSFSDHCKTLERDRVTDVFCLQLMQVNQVTEDVALSIQATYPTVHSLVQAYMNLDGDVGAQEKLLQGIPIRGSSRNISPSISKNVYKLIWGS